MIRKLQFSMRANVFSTAAVVLFGAMSFQSTAQQMKLNSINQSRTWQWTPTSENLIRTDNDDGKINVAMPDVTISGGWGTLSLVYAQNRRSWTISVIHGHQIMKNVLKIEKIPRGLLFAKSMTESLCACDDGMIPDPLATYPLPNNSEVLDPAMAQRVMDKGCFQFTNQEALFPNTKFSKNIPQKILSSDLPCDAS